MKTLSILTILLYSSSLVAETYSCNYSEIETNKTITFERVTHSHFKICDKENCDNKRYLVIYSDKNNLIFGNINLKEEKELDEFQLVLIDKQVNSFTVAKISLPNSNIKNTFINAECSLN